ALDREDVAAGLGWVLNGVVDAVAGGAVLGNELEAAAGERVAHIDLERVQRRLLEHDVAEVGAVRLDVLQVLAQQFDALGLRALRVHVLRGEGGDERDPVLSARDRDVEPPLASLGQKRAEAIRQVATAVLAVADREDDGVARVTLDALEVLDEEALFLVFGEEVTQFVVKFRVLTQPLDPALLDPVRVPYPHRDHTEGLVRARSSVLKDQVNDGVDLRAGAVRVGLRIARDRDVTQHGVAADAGESDQLSVVDVCVRERDQGFVATSVVPAQHPEAKQRTKRVEDRLEPLRAGDQRDRRIHLLELLFFLRRLGDEKGRRRQLLLVAGHDELSAAQDRGDRVSRRDLRRLVEDDYVEVG